jgi:hypothetical protein
MKRYAVLAIALGLVVGATLRWATSPIAPTASPYAPDAWQD